MQGFIKQRQARQVRNLRQEHGIVPKLLIIMSARASDVIKTYVRMKRRYAEDILIDVEVAELVQKDMLAAISAANGDENIQGIIVQLPLDDTAQTSEICNAIAPEKDVDGLGAKSEFFSATAQAIDWLLVGYGVELEGKKIALIGNGKLVGAPLGAMWRRFSHDVTTFDVSTPLVDMKRFDIIVTATGVPGLIKSEMLRQNAVLIDAGTASEQGKLVGDASDEVRQRTDITITPKKGGVGPLTYVVRGDHLIEACLRRAGKL